MVRWVATSAEVARWVEEAVGPVSSISQAKARPWSVVWQLEAAGETYWAKQDCPGQTFEGELVALLARRVPTYVVPVVAVEPERGLLLTPDQGPVFAETAGADDLDAWCRLVVRAAELGRAAADHAPDLLATGLTTPRQPDEVAASTTPWLEELAALGLPETVVHNDLHGHNAFERGEGLRLFDFGDAVFAHPLSELLVPLGVLAERLDEPGPHDPRLRRVADAALEVWSDLAPVSALRRALPAALQLGRLGRAESWARIEPHFGPGEAAKYGGGARSWLQRLGDPVPVSFP